VETLQTAAIDLANLLQDQSAGMLDPARAVTLLERAWNDKVPIAAYELGQVYEIGLPMVAAGVDPKLQADLAKAWSWYQKGADLGEPNALAWFAERDENNAPRREQFHEKELAITSSLHSLRSCRQARAR